MDTYMMMLYVSLEQEKALKQFFLDNGWAYCKPDLTAVTDNIGPLVAQTPHTKKLPASQKQKETTLNKSTPSKTGLLHNYSIAQTQDTYVSEVLANTSDGPSPKKRKFESSKGKTTLAPTRSQREENSPGGNVNLDGTVTIDEQESINAEGSTVMDSSGEENGSFDDSDSDYSRMTPDDDSEYSSMTTEKSSQTRYGKMNPKVVLQKLKTRNDKAGTGIIVKTESLNMPLIVKKEIFSCDFCGKSFTIQRHLKTHCKKVHDEDIESDVPEGKVESQNKVYKCDQCDCAYKRVSSLKQHMRVKHGVTFKMKDKQFTCGICLLKYETSHFLELHQADKHGKTLADTGTTVHKCKECGETFDKYRAFRLHRKTHETQKTHVCEICGRVFGRADSLHAHRKFVHLGIKRACDRNRKEGERSFVCEVCGKSFFRKSNMNEHIQVKHSGQPFPHPCEHCDKRFIRPHILEYHVNREHLKTKPFRCEKCKKNFYSLHSLKDHKNICNQPLDAKLSCEQCGKLFSSSHNLKLHMQAIHSEPALVCPCGTIVRWQSSVTKHKRRCSLYNSKVLKTRRAKKERLEYVEQVVTEVEERPTIENGAVMYMESQNDENQEVGAQLVSGLESGQTVVVSEAEADVVESVGKLLEAIPGAGIGDSGEQQEVTVVQEEVVEGEEGVDYNNVRVVTEDGQDNSKVYYVIHY